MRNMLLQALPIEEQDRLRPFLQEVILQPAQVLILADAPIQDVYFPYDAVTSTLQLLKNGATVEAGLMGLEGLVGIQLWLRLDTTPSLTLVQVPGSAAHMTRADFLREVLARPASPLNVLIARYVHGFLVLTSQTAACNRIHSLDQRLCRWLRMVYNRVPDRPDLPLRQEFLASMLGVQRPTVSTAAHMLQKAGLIEYARGRLRIHNPRGLGRRCV